jgi:hypothetical protein
MFHTNIVEKITTHILCAINLLKKLFVLLNKVQDYYRAGEATDDNMTHAHCMLDTRGYKHAIGIRNAYCFSTAKLDKLTSMLRYTYFACRV